MRYLPRFAPWNLQPSSPSLQSAAAGMGGAVAGRQAVSLLSTVAVGLALVSCQPVTTQVNQLSLIVEPSDRPGTYRLSGTTDLPDGTELTVQGLRHLQPQGQLLSELQAQDHYAILARNRVQVEAGQWSVTLQLWQPNGAGDPLESWQMVLPQSDRSFEASPDVQFTVSTPPSGDERRLDAQWQSSKVNPALGEIRFTPDGDWYLQARINRPIALPQGEVPDNVALFNANPQLLAESAIPQAKAVTGAAADLERTTNAPLASSEMLR